MGSEMCIRDRLLCLEDDHRGTSPRSRSWPFEATLFTVESPLHDGLTSRLHHRVVPWYRAPVTHTEDLVVYTVVAGHASYSHRCNLVFHLDIPLPSPVPRPPSCLLPRHLQLSSHRCHEYIHCIYLLHRQGGPRRVQVARSRISRAWPAGNDLCRRLKGQVRSWGLEITTPTQIEPQRYRSYDVLDGHIGKPLPRWPSVEY